MGERHNISGAEAISGSTTRTSSGMWSGCSLSAAIAILWPFGLGLYRYAMLNAMFLRVDAAEAAGLGESDAQLGGRHHWRPADEFECWRRSCADKWLGSYFLGLSAKGVHSHLMPRVWEIMREERGDSRHPVSVHV